jgi:hypothetical protein
MERGIVATLQEWRVEDSCGEKMSQLQGQMPRCGCCTTLGGSACALQREALAVVRGMARYCIHWRTRKVVVACRAAGQSVSVVVCATTYAVVVQM